MECPSKFKELSDICHNRWLATEGSCRQYAQWEVLVVAVAQPPVSGRAKVLSGLLWQP